MKVLKEYWFLISTIGLAIVYYMFQRRGEKIEKLIFDIQTTEINNKIKKVKEEADKDENKYKKDRGDYDALLNEHRELASKLGIGPDSQ